MPCHSIFNQLAKKRFKTKICLPIQCMFKKASWAQAFKNCFLGEKTFLFFRSVNYPQPKHEMATCKYQAKHAWDCSLALELVAT